MEQIKYPRGETVWVGYYDVRKNLRFIMTSKENDRSLYFLYKLVDGRFKKIGRAQSPKEIEDKFEILKRLLEGSDE